MNIKQLAKAQKIYSHIHQLDKQIIELHKVAQAINNGLSTLDISLNISDISSINVDNAFKEEDDGVGMFQQEFRKHFLRFPILGPWEGSLIGRNDFMSKDDDKRQVIKTDLSDVLSFKILSVLIQDKEEKRQLLINSLKSLGVKI